MPVEDFEERGFTILNIIFSDREIQRLSDELTSQQLQCSKAGMRRALRFAEVAALAGDPRLAKAASDILDGDAFPFNATLFDKSPRANWLVVWHQDTALPLRKRTDVPGWGPWSVKEGVIYAHAPASALEKVVALRVHLDDSGPANGPLRVLPGTHTRGVLSDDQIEQLRRELAPVECRVPKGGVLAMSPLIVHSSSKSQVEASRRVLHVEYAVARIPATGLELAVA